MLTPEIVREFCIENRYFTHGSNVQYGKLFDMVRNKEPLGDIALVIWLCSDTDKTRSEIREDLLAIALTRAAKSRRPP